MIIFGTVRFLSKKSNQIKKNLRKKPKSVQTGRFRFGSVFRTKTDSNRFGSVCLVWLGFGLVWLGFGSVFSGLTGFFRFGSVLAQLFSGLARFFFRFFFSLGSVEFGSVLDL